MADHRTEATYKHQDLSLNENSMKATVMGPDGPLGKVRFEFVVCPTCDGTGTHVDPAIDAHGLTEREMARRGPDFRERYFSGAYDQPCNECGGRRVVPKLTPKTDEEKEIVSKRREMKRERKRTRQMKRAEKRMAAGRRAY